MDIPEQLALLERNTESIVPKGGLEQKLTAAKQERRKLVVKLGLDPTAPDIHLGHTVVLRKLRQFQDLGHMVVLIVGDFTAKIGDPSGVSQTRPMLADATIKQNAATYYEQAAKILDTDKQKLAIRFNSEWLSELKLDDILRIMAKATVAQVLTREDFKRRYDGGKPIGVHELLYPLMQAYDSVAVKSDIEIGGTDQTFNLLMGRELMPHFDLEPQLVLTMPLIPGTDGKKKMSKSLGNYIGITESAKDIYGKVMSLPDALIKTYAVLTTDEDITDAMVKSDPLAAKKTLALTLATMFTSTEEATEAAESFTSTFSKGEFPADAEVIQLKKAVSLLELVTKVSAIFASGSEARRKIAEGAVRLNGESVKDPAFVVDASNGELQLQAGKKRFYRISGHG